MKNISIKVLKFLFKIGIIFGVTVGVILAISHFFGFELEYAFFIVGAIYAFIGGTSVLGDSGRRSDVNYLYARSISSKSSVDEIGSDKSELGQGGSFTAGMIIVAILLIIVAYYL